MASKKWELYDISGGKVARKKRSCPKCGTGVFLAEHKNRVSCGKCGYTEFAKGRVEEGKPPENLKTEKPAKEKSRGSLG